MLCRDAVPNMRTRIAETSLRLMLLCRMERALRVGTRQDMTNCRDCDGIQNILAAFTREVQTAAGAVPMFHDSGLRAGRALSFDMIFVLMQTNQGESFIRHKRYIIELHSFLHQKQEFAV